MPTIFTLPRERMRGVQSKFRLRAASVLSLQPFSGSRSVYGPNTHLWATEISTASMERQDWQWLSAFFSRAAGVSGLIRMGDPWRRLTLYDASLTPTTSFFDDATGFDDGTGFSEGYLPPHCVAGEAALAGAVSLVLSGLPASLAACLHAGDLFEIRPNGIAAAHGHLYEIGNDASTDAEGKVRVNFRPELYASVAVGDQVVLRDAMSVFRPLGDDEGVVERFLASIGSTGFSLVEERP